MLNEKQARKLTNKVLARSKADEAVVSLTGRNSTHLRFARNSPSTSGTYENLSLRITSIFGKRSGSVRINQFDDRTVAGAVERSESIARLTPENPEHLPVLGPQTYASVDGFLAPEEDALPRGVATCLRDAGSAGVVAAGFSETSSGFRCMATSRGLFAYHRESSAYLSETARTPSGKGSGWASQAATSAGDLDFGRVSRRAIDKAVLSEKARALKPGTYPTILEPACVASLVGRLMWSMDARSADEGRSFFSKRGGGNRLGERLFPKTISVYSDPAAPGVPARPWGEDGLPLGRRDWVRNGRIENLAYSRYWAQKNGVEVVPYGSNTIMAGGNGSLDDLISSTRRGVLVTSLWYIRDVDPRTLLLTGLTRDGVFWIEDGKIAYPVQNFRWNDSPISILKNTVGLSRAVRVPARGARSGNVLVPAVKTREFHFSSVSDAV